MWLPTDERYVLLAYYANVFDLNDRNVEKYLKQAKLFHSTDWTYVLKRPLWIPMVSSWLVKRRAKSIRAYGERDVSPSHESILSKNGRKIIEKTIQMQRRLQIANAHLTDRQLVEITPHSSEPGIEGVFLTLEGYDLARCYSNWFDRTGLCFREYKDHWIVMVVGFVVGVLGTLVVQWCSD